MTLEDDNKTDDALLSAYAMGELDAEAAREVEAWLARDPQAQRQWAEWRETGDLLTRAFGEEPAIGLGQAQLASLEARLTRREDVDPGEGHLSALQGAAEVRHVTFSRDGRADRLRRWFSVAAAALLILSLGVGMFIAGREVEQFRYTQYLVDSGAAETLLAVEEITAVDPSPTVMLVAVSAGTSGSWAVSTSGASGAFSEPLESPTSRFPLRVGKGGLAMVQASLQAKRLPLPSQVSVNELINAFAYDYAPPARDSEHPLAVYTDAGPCPWNLDHRLVRVAIRTRGQAGTVVARGVEARVEFNPARVLAYRRLGDGDSVWASPGESDAGESLPGEGSVTALYEMVPAAGVVASKSPPPLRYQRPASLKPAGADELLAVTVTYQPTGREARGSVVAVLAADEVVVDASDLDEDMHLATAVAGVGLLLQRDSKLGRYRLGDVEATLVVLEQGGVDPRRAELLELIRLVQALQDS